MSWGMSCLCAHYATGESLCDSKSTTRWVDKERCCVDDERDLGNRIAAQRRRRLAALANSRHVREAWYLGNAKLL